MPGERGPVGPSGNAFNAFNVYLLRVLVFLSISSQNRMAWSVVLFYRIILFLI